MANILLTEKCVRSCPYCFAKKHMSDKAPEDILSWDDLIYIADFFEASKEFRLALLGGEPTLHPDFTKYVRYLYRRGFRVNVFTSAIASDSKLNEMEEHLLDIPPDKLSFVCNLNDPVNDTANEYARINKFLKVFGKHSSPGFNIYSTDF